MFSYFFSIVGSSVKMYSTTTGEIVSTLSASRPLKSDSSPPTNGEQRHNSDLITAAVLNPNNPLQLITGSLNGYIMVWDILEASLLQIFDLQQPITHLCAHEKFKDTVFVGASRAVGSNPALPKPPEDWGVVLRVVLSQHPLKITVLGQTRRLSGLAISASGTWVIATGGHKIYVAQASSTKSKFVKYVSPERLTCLACHPLDDHLVTGDEKGNIRLWYALDERIVVKDVGLEKKAPTATLHWHAHAVSSLAFTSNGAYLLSGGEEAVLVIWQLQTGKKEFVPRLGSPIETIAVAKAMGGEDEFFLGLADGTHVFVTSGDLKIARSFSRIKFSEHIAISRTFLL